MLVRTAREIGARVRFKREQAGLTQQQLADRAHVSREWLLALEGGKDTVRLAKVLDVLNVLGVGVSLDDLPVRDRS